MVDPKDVSDHLRAGRGLNADDADDIPPPVSGLRLSSVDGDGVTRMPLAHGSQKEVADRLIIEMQGKDANPPVFTRGEFHRYDRKTGVWKVIDRAVVDRTVQAYDGIGVSVGREKILKMSSSMRNGIVDCAEKELADREFFDGDGDAPGGRQVPGFAFTDCFVKVTKDEGIKAVRHDPEHRATYSIGLPYQPNATCPTWKQWLSEWLGHSTTEHGEQNAMVENAETAVLEDVERMRAQEVQRRIDLIQEVLGVYLVGKAAPFEKAVMLHGKGSNGKSIFLEIVASLFPRSVVCSVNPKLMGHEYNRAMFVGKAVNLVDEVRPTDIVDSEALKEIISGNPIHARVIREKPLTFRPTAGHFLGANRFPVVNDHSHGFWRRWIVMPLHRTFAVDAAKRESLVEQMKAERAGIIRWALDGALRAIKRGSYAIPPSSMAALDDWQGRADQARDFMNTCVTLEAPSSDAICVRAQKMYEAYRRWSDKAGHSKPLSLKNFGEQFKEALPATTKDDQGRVKDSYTRGSAGVLYRVKLLSEDEWRW